MAPETDTTRALEERICPGVSPAIESKNTVAADYNNVCDNLARRLGTLGQLPANPGALSRLEDAVEQGRTPSSSALEVPVSINQGRWYDSDVLVVSPFDGRPYRGRLRQSWARVLLDRQLVYPRRWQTVRTRRGKLRPKNESPRRYSREVGLLAVEMDVNGDLRLERLCGRASAKVIGHQLQAHRRLPDFPHRHRPPV